MSTLAETREALPAGTWQIDPAHSQVGFAVEYLVGTFRGGFSPVGATLEVGEEGEARLSGSAKVESVKVQDENLTAHLLSMERRYQYWRKAVAAPPVDDAAAADPQLYFQEQFHETQRTVERLAAARGVPVPEQLGFPKELPPSETVPRLLAQLALLKEAAALVLEQGVSALTSLKIEDPEAVPEPEGDAVFLMRLPVRVRLTGSLPHVMTVLGAVHRARPLIDVRALRLAPAASQSGAGEAASGQASGERLDAELVLARYLVLEAAPDAAATEAAAATQKSSSSTKPRAPRPTRPRRKEPE